MHEIPKDQLTPLERMKLFDEGKEIDRIPCCLDTGETMAPMLGIPIDQYYHSSDKMCELEEWLFANFRSDGVGLSTTLRQHRPAKDPGPDLKDHRQREAGGRGP